MIALSSSAARRRALWGGLMAAVAAASLPIAPPSVVWAPLMLLVVAGGWTMHAGLAMSRAASREAFAARAALWPWMTEETDASQHLRTAFAQANWGGGDADVVWGPGVLGKGRKASWEWAPVSWSDPEATPAANGDRPKVGAWALLMTFDHGPPLAWGRGRGGSGHRAPKGYGALTLVHPDASARFSIHAVDAVRSGRAWTPVAVEALTRVPRGTPLGWDASERSVLVVVPASWLTDGVGIAALADAFRAATGKERWDAAVGWAWHPVAARGAKQA